MIFLEQWGKSFALKISRLSSQLTSLPNRRFSTKVIDNLLFEVMNILTGTTNTFCRNKKNKLWNFSVPFLSAVERTTNKKFTSIFWILQKLKLFFDCVFSLANDVFFCFLSCFATSWMKNYTYEKFHAIFHK